MSRNGGALLFLHYSISLSPIIIVLLIFVVDFFLVFLSFPHPFFRFFPFFVAKSAVQGIKRFLNPFSLVMKF